MPAGPPKPSAAPRDTVPGRIGLHLKGLDGLFDREARPDYPHTGPMVAESVADFLLASAREQRGHPHLEVTVSLESPALSSDEETEARTQFSRFFTEEGELASLDQRVNRAEGLGSLRFAIPLVAVALLTAGLFYSQVGQLTGTGYLAALTYLVLIIIVWVMLWDPIEVLLFNSYLLRSRVRALRKLATASVVFEYGPESAPGPNPTRH